MNRNNIFFFFMVLAMSFWAGSWISAKLIASDINPFLAIFWRFISTFLSFLPVLLFRMKKIHYPTKKAILFTLGAAFFISCYNILFLIGLKGSLAGKAGVIVTTVNPLITFLLTALIFKQKVKPDQKIALFIGALGGFILTEPWTWQSSSWQDMYNLIFIGCAFCWSCLTILSQQAQKEMHPLWYNTLLYLGATIIIGFLLPEKAMDASLSISTKGWLNILYLGIFAGSLGAGIYFFAAKRLGASRASTMTFLVPVIALFLGWLILDEQIQWTTVLGGGLSILAVLIINEKIRIPRFQTSG